jgi:hypothetical protein
MNTGDLFIIIVFGGGILCAIVHVVMDNWRKARAAEQNAVLKKDMIERGFSPDEIVRVIESGGTPEEADARDVGTALVDQGYSSDDIAAVTASYDRCPPPLKTAIRASVVKMIQNGYKGRKIAAYIDSRYAASGERREPQPVNAR